MIRVLSQLLILAILWLIACGFTYWLHPDAKVLFQGGQVAVPQDENEISLVQAKREMADGKVLWVDVRPLSEFSQEHIPGAENVPADEAGALESKLYEWTRSDRLKPDTRIIVYCATSGCGTSHQFRNQLISMNNSLNVLVLAGGWSEWKRGEAAP